MFGIRFSNAKLTGISITSCHNIDYHAAQNTLMAHRLLTAPTAIPCGAVVICSDIRGNSIPLTALVAVQIGVAVGPREVSRLS